MMNNPITVSSSNSTSLYHHNTGTKPSNNFSSNKLYATDSNKGADRMYLKSSDIPDVNIHTAKTTIRQYDSNGNDK